MPTRLVIALIAVICAFYYSFEQYATLSKKRIAYEKLARFASVAQENLNGAFVNIGNILSDVFCFDDSTSFSPSLLLSNGFDGDTVEEIMDYTVKYSILDIDELRNTAATFSQYASRLYNETLEECKKRLPSLLCPPLFSLIFLIIFM